MIWRRWVTESSSSDDTQQNIQMELDFSSALSGAARGVGGEETESLMATSGPESPARTDRLMEEVCERENLKEALRQVKGNKGSAGVDGITVSQLTDYLKQHWPVIREQLLVGGWYAVKDAEKQSPLLPRLGW
jgi:RNA-directed DNA polymerase